MYLLFVIHMLVQDIVDMFIIQKLDLCWKEHNIILLIWVK